MLDKNGFEVPDDEPMELPAGFKVPETMEQMMARLLKRPDILNAMRGEEHESFEESEDFDVDDDTFDPSSPWEEVYDPVLKRGITYDEFCRNREVYEQRYQEAHDRAFKELDLSDALRARGRRPAEQSGPKAAHSVEDKKSSE